MKRILLCTAAMAVALAPLTATAQTATSQSDATANATQAEVTTTSAPTTLTDGSGLLGNDALKELVAPIALYPDTLLIQVLVASTFPLELVKADRLLKDADGKSQEETKALIEKQNFDDSVEVMAIAFPELVARMVVHIDWTETMGQAMLAQSDDVMDAVQDMRAVAEENGVLVSGDEQTVEVTQSETGDQTIIIQPTDPQQVYVPEYQPQQVYYDNNGGDVQDALVNGLLLFSTVAIIDNIFDKNDPWDDYWGCRNCGWGGGGIIRNPNIDIDIDGDVIIGNEINRDKIAWNPDNARRNEARDTLENRFGKGGSDLGAVGIGAAAGAGAAIGSRMPSQRPSRGDELRNRLGKDLNVEGGQLNGRDAQELRNRRNTNGTGAARDRVSGERDRINRDNPSTRPTINRTRDAKPATREIRRPSKPEPAARSRAGSNGGAFKRDSSPARSNRNADRGRKAMRNR